MIFKYTEMLAPKNNLASEELQEWLEAFHNIMKIHGSEKSQALLETLIGKSGFSGYGIASPFCNNFPLCTPYPGDLKIEAQLEHYIRWNALAMVHRASKWDIGGHISTYASIATLYEVGFNHFWQGGANPDLILFQGHSSPGIYARSFLEGRFDEESLEFFRREAKNPKGLSSYPHPWLMPDYWSFPTVSMGLGALQAIYLARLQVFLSHRTLWTSPMKTIWCVCGDGEMDEPESTSSLTLAGREHIPHLIFLVNCNLQRLDGPVRGHGQIIQELDVTFSTKGWAVVKLIWSQAWNELFQYDLEGHIQAKLNTLPDLALQSFARFGVEYFKKEFFENDPLLHPLLTRIPNDLFQRLKPGAHDPLSVFQAYTQAIKLSLSGPVVILAHSIKGYGLENFAQAFNTAHNTKHLSDEALCHIANDWKIPLEPSQILEAQYYRPPADDRVMQYLKKQRQSKGGFLPSRTPSVPGLYSLPPQSLLTLFDRASSAKAISSTMALVRILGSLVRDPHLGEQIVPIVADEARTFGMEGLIKQLKIYQPQMSSYLSVDAEEILPYAESSTGRVFQEGINEAGASACWLSCATSYMHYKIPLIPFYTYYSMFGFQRVGDLFWAAGDSRARGFLIGATFGRTALSGEGLQHQDGHSLVCMSAIPSMRCYEPCFAFELSYIIHYGLTCFANNEDWMFYLTTTNENMIQPKLDFSNPQLYQQVIAGMYGFHLPDVFQCCLLASGPFVYEAQKAADFLNERYHVVSQIWCVTSFTELRRTALIQDRNNTLSDDDPALNHIQHCLSAVHPIVAVSDSWKLQADLIRPWIQAPYHVLGTDGFGRSDTRENLRDHFEVSWKHIVFHMIALLRQHSPLASWPTKKTLLTDLELSFSLQDPLSS